ncbi:hypothetical protein F01_140164 [Burkholderia cenocepacia]|nr:hypothetical protein F01_140164 [Burkholderia cenocepacia]
MYIQDHPLAMSARVVPVARQRADRACVAHAGDPRRPAPAEPKERLAASCPVQTMCGPEYFGD